MMDEPPWAPREACWCTVVHCHRYMVTPKKIDKCLQNGIDDIYQIFLRFPTFIIIFVGMAIYIYTQLHVTIHATIFTTITWETVSSNKFKSDVRSWPTTWSLIGGCFDSWLSWFQSHWHNRNNLFLNISNWTSWGLVYLGLPYLDGNISSRML
jgi:hypothetical protein